MDKIKNFVASYVNRFVGTYFENVESQQLNFGILRGGKMLLTDLVLKPSIVEDLDLPIKLFYGTLGKLDINLSLSWSALLVEVSIEDLYLIVVPNQEVKYDSVKEKKRAFDAKQAEIDQVEKAKKMEAERDKPKASDGLLENIIAQAIKNVQVKIKNIHIRYEDKITNPGNPFCMGLTLKDLEVVTTDETWKPCAVAQGNVPYIFKILDLEGFAVYWNCKSPLYANLPKVDLVDCLLKEIATKTNTPTNYSYILGPINSSVRLRINRKPECDEPAFSIPKIHLNLDLEKLAIGISKSQYRDLIGLSESMSRFSRGTPFRKYRPDLQEYKGHAKEWWHFAYTCVLEQEVRRKRRNWDWNHIRRHVSLCRDYRRAYELKWQSKELAKELEGSLMELETELDAFNIIIIRQMVELKVARAPVEEPKPKPKSWFGGWFGGGSAQEGDDMADTGTIVSVKKLEEGMTPEEKAALYKAIDYQENAAPAEFPKEYEDISCIFLLRILEIQLKNDDLDIPTVLTSELKGVKCRFDKRTGAGAIKVSVNVDDLTTYGLQQDDLLPQIISSNVQKENKVLLDVIFETNPLDESCDQRLHLNAEPLRIVYDAQTINNTNEIFKVPESSALEKLSSVAGNGLSNIKEMSATGMQHAINEHNHLDLNINIHAPICILPYGGKYLGQEHLLVINLGFLTIITESQKSNMKDVRQLHLEGAKEDEILEEMIAQSYDEYKVALTELQIILAEGSEDWETYVKQSESTKLHILNPINLRLKLYKCVLTDDPRLPLSKITGELPSIDVVLTDTRLVMLLDLFMSIPFPSKEEELPSSRPLSETRSNASSMMILKYLEMPEKAKSTQSKAKQPDESSQLQQFTTVDMKFVMTEMSLNLNHQEHSESPIINVLNFKVTNLELGLVQQTFNKKVEVRLASVDLNHFRTEATIPLISTPFSEGSDQYLFTVVFTQVDKKSPEFHSKYHSCESKLFLHFACLNVLLHQESLQELMKFLIDTQNDLNEIMNSKPAHRMLEIPSKSSVKSSISRQLSEIGARGSAKLLTVPKKKKTTVVVVETILFKLNAKLDQVEVKFVSDREEISFCAIKGITTEIIVKKPYTHIKAKLLDLAILDLNPKSVHKQILTVSDEFALDAQVVMYKLEEGEFSNNKVDMSVGVTMGRLKIVFLNWFISNMLGFLNNFKAAQATIRDASAAAADAAKQNMRDAYEKATKISLNVDLKAPYIVVPVDSSSYHAVEVDLGHLAIVNSFLVLATVNEHGYPAVVDEMKLKLNNMKVQRIELDKEHKVVNSCALLEPLTCILTVRRNLSTSWYEAVPDMSVAGSIKTIKLLLSQADYQMIMSILSGNLAEGKASDTVEQQPPAQSRVEPTQSVATAQFTIRQSVAESAVSTHSDIPRPVEERVHVVLKFNFTMESFIIDLYTGAAETDTPVFVKREPKTALGRFSLLGLSLKGRRLSDDSMVVSLLLVNCLLDDMRAGREDKLRRLIERKSDGVIVEILSSDAKESIVAPKSMIDVTYQQSKTDKFADVRVYSFTVILSVDYLKKVAAFFNSTPASATTPEEVKTTASSAHLQRIEVVAEENPIQMTVNLKVEMPDIILVEHMDNEDTNAMIMNNEIVINFRRCGSHQVLNGTIKDLQLYTCCYNPMKRAETRGEFIYPVTVSIAGSTPEDEGLHLEVIFTDIRIRVSPDTIELLNRVLVTMSGREATDENVEEELDDHSNLWEFKSFADNEFWFLKTDLAEDALVVESLDEIEMANQRHEAIRKKELCFLTMPSLVLTVEAGVGNKTLPMLLLESSFRGNVNDWSSKISIDTSLTLQMGYYNSKLALWEPLVEPVEVIRGERSSYVPWEIKLEVAMNEKYDQQQPIPSAANDSFEQIEAQLQPTMSINVSSINSLELTVTKTCLEVLNNLGKAFSNAVKSTEMKQIKRSAAFLVQNDTGIPITLCLDRSTFAVEGAMESDEVTLESEAQVALTLNSSGESNQKLQLKKEITKTRVEIEHLLHVKVEYANCELSLPVVRADKRFFLLNYRAFRKDNWGLVSAVKVDDGVKIITLRSVVQVHNHFNIPVEILYMTEKGDELESIAIIQPGTTFNVPLNAVYSTTNELFFCVDGYSVTTIPYIWKDLQSSVEVKKTLLCNPKNQNVIQEPFVIQAVGEIEQIYYENTTRHTMASTCFNIHLRPTVAVKNCLPVDIICCGQNIATEILVKAGETIQLPNANPGNSYVVIRLPSYLEKEWSCRREISSTQSEFSVWQFDSHDSVAKMTLDLGMHVLDENGTVVMSLYCPFWMLNKTGLMLSYKKSKKTEKHEASGSPSKASDENLNILHHPAHFKGPILFSFNAKNFFGKKKASVRIEYGEWSDKFSLDVAGSSGVVACRSNNQIYQIGVHNQLTYNGLTKQVTFTPYYILVNNAPFTIECQEFDRPADAWKAVESKSCTALWSKSERDDKLLKLRIEGTEEVSAPFLFTESHTTLLKLQNKYGGINVDIQLTEGGVFISFTQYQPGMAPALIINHTPYTMKFWEKETVQIRQLPPNYNFLYTWENPSGPRVLAWDIGRSKELNDDLRKDGGGEFSPSDDFTVYWASFLNGMQRTLLFTTEPAIAEDAQSAKQFEVADQEITVSIHGLGLSLVNNETLHEIMYMGLASSGVIWETSKSVSKRFKQMNDRDNTILEAAYQQYLKITQIEGTSVASRVTLENKMEVDFDSLTMLKPSKKQIRRTFMMGLWLQMKRSQTQLQLHAKINRLQIDNQMYDCIFPVVLAPVPPPKSVALNSAHKPFMEVSIVQMFVKHSQIRQFKYFKVLIQEFHVKVELGFVNAVMAVLQAAQYSEQEVLQQFQEDLKLVDVELYEKVSFQSLKEKKSFYDLLHFSPLKIHVSFSLAASGGSEQGSATPNFLNVLLQGLGVTLTDMQDVIFKLAYFEREYKFLTQKQLINEASSHYVGQMVKQLYVLVLGLDVLGNPYGLVLGITKGVEDLFYEPFQGAIQGPGEFAEGLVLGMRSLFGHTVGGAAGAVSRITGAMGKGLAALTFDKDYQRKRRDQISKKPATVQEGFARGGKGLVMGVYDGVTGVFTKPITGAREKGVEGFFTGLGKGAVGFFARPTAGVIDFASGSLDAVKRATDLGEETNRLRAPRCMHSDNHLRPYNRLEAEGNRLLKELGKGKYASTDVYCYHHTIVEKKEILLLTDKRIAYVMHNDIFGSWQIEWSYTWQDLSLPAQIMSNGVYIKVSDKKKKGLFSSSVTGKTILVDDPELQEQIIEEIESLRGKS